MSKHKQQPKLSDQTAKELEWFLKERELNRELEQDEIFEDPYGFIQRDTIQHLEQLREILSLKIAQMKMRTKNIY